MSRETYSANDELAALIAKRNRPQDAASNEALPTAEPQLPFLLMRLGDRWFGLRAESVREVVGSEPITRVPGQPNQVRGVAMIHGRLVPVIALDVLMSAYGFSVPAVINSDDSAGRRLVVVAHEDEEIAIIADDARGVVYLPVAMRSQRDIDSAGIIADEAPWGDYMVVLLDGPALLAAATRAERA